MSVAISIDKRTVRNRFGTAAGHYDDFATIQQITANRLIQRINALAKSRAGGILLDLGCGTGSSMNKLYQTYDGHSIGLDLARRMLRNVRGTGSNLQADMQQLPIAKNSIDLLVSNAACQWTSSDRVIDEIARVLKPNGIAALSLFVNGSLPELACGILQDRIKTLPSEHQWYDEALFAGLSIEHREIAVHTQGFSSKGALFDSIRYVGASISPIRHRYLGKAAYKTLFGNQQDCQLSWRTLYLVFRAENKPG